LDPIGVLIRFAGRISPSFQERLSWRRYRRGDLALRVVDELVGKGDVVLDVGADHGLYTARLSQLVGRKGRVLAFEPNPESFRHLEELAAARPNVTARATGLSDSAGEVRLHIPIVDGERLPGLGSVSVAERKSGLEHEAVAVRVETLDSAVPADLGAVAFMKCDVEGHEFPVLRGAERTLRRSLPAILIEIEQRHQDEDVQRTFDFLADLGYSGYALHADGLRPLDEFDVERDQLAFLGPEFEVVPSPDYVHNFLFVSPGTEVGRLLGS
jgi:FkbM family methyltransferase